MKKADNEGVKLRIKEMHEFIDSERIELKEYDESLVRKLIKKIVVCDEHFEVYFKSGIKINISKKNSVDIKRVMIFMEFFSALLSKKWG